MTGSPQAIEALGALPDASQVDALRDFDLYTKVQVRQSLTEERDRLERRIREINDAIATALTVAELRAVKCGVYRVIKVESHGPSTIKKEILLEKGVSADIIVAATVPGKPYTTVQVRRLEPSLG